MPCINDGCSEILQGPKKLDKHVNFYCTTNKELLKWQFNDDRRYTPNKGAPKADDVLHNGNIYFKHDQQIWKCVRCEKTATPFNIKNLLLHVNTHEEELHLAWQKLDIER